MGDFMQFQQHFTSSHVHVGPIFRITSVRSSLNYVTFLQAGNSNSRVLGTWLRFQLLQNSVDRARESVVRFADQFPEGRGLLDQHG